MTNAASEADTLSNPIDSAASKLDDTSLALASSQYASPQTPKAEIADLAFTNILLEISGTGSTGQYAPSSGEAIDLRLFPIPEQYATDIEALRHALRDRIKRVPPGTRFSHNVGSLRLRVTPLEAEGNELWVILRRLPPMVPAPEALGISPAIVDEISRWLTIPGLTLIAGTFAAGKTWTGCTMLKAHVVKYGGLAISMESPTEFFMHGPMGEWGRCIQIPVGETTGQTWEQIAANVRKASPSIIYVGEVSTPAIAKIVVALSTTGRPILTTCHGSSHADAINTLASFAEEAGLHTAHATLAASLVGVAHQTMVRGSPVVRLLSMDQPSTEDIREAIATGDNEAINQAAVEQEEASMDGMTDLSAPRGTRP